MQNKIKTILISTLILMGLSGCVKFNTTMDIKKDKSMDYSIIYAANTSLIDTQEIFSQEDKKELESKGFKIEDYKDDKYSGIKLTNNFKNIDDISTEKDTEFSLSKVADKNTKLENMFKVKKGILKNTYTANFKFDQNDSGLNDNDFSTKPLNDEKINSDGVSKISSTPSYDTFRNEVEKIYNQAQSKYITDSQTNNKDTIYCNEKACTTPNKINLNITKNYIIKFNKEGFITYICIWDESYVYEKSGTNIKIKDINSENIKENSNIKTTKYTLPSSGKKEVPFAFTPSYQTLKVAKDEEDNNFEESMVDAMLGAMDLKYIVTLPYKSISSNATEKTNDDKTLTWDLTALKENDNIKYEFYIYNMTNIYLIIGAFIIIIAIVVILLIIKSKKSKENNNQENDKAKDQSVSQITIDEQSISNEINNLENSIVENENRPLEPNDIQVSISTVNEITAPIVEEIPTPIVETPEDKEQPQVLEVPEPQEIEEPKTTNEIENTIKEQTITEPQEITPTQSLEEPHQDTSSTTIKEVQTMQETNVIVPNETVESQVSKDEASTQITTENINQ